MGNLVVNLLFLVVISYASGQCGCPKQKLLKRGQDQFHYGDMLLDKGDIAKIKGYKHYDAQSKKWPHNTLSYAFHEDFPENDASRVKESLAELQRDLEDCVKFEETSDRHHVTIYAENSMGCVSNVGYKLGDIQFINLQVPGCTVLPATIKHEFMHSLGFLHTHMRKDRDDYITIKWDKIQTSECHNFEKCAGCEFDGPYETTSLMHYESQVFSCMPLEQTILKKDGRAIEFNLQTTQNDLNMIKKVYGC